ncbi:hypothetical protein [Hymenobacter baengnokdamensis]|uniref:hypothetical protein n=1 Tax=Hymenobacter baengnokdamensis TaxID=2615203 RepID=UPI0012483911|nr:hypothetical protein [Hymenobacter baengnokdamensis]
MKKPAARKERRATKTVDWRPAFLKSMKKLGNVTRACTAAKIGRSTAYDMYEGDADFARDWDEALEEATDLLELEARRRAEKGVRTPIYQGGLLVGHKQMYSDGLMQVLLKANRPQKYKEFSAVDHTTLGREMVGSQIYLPDNGRDASMTARAMPESELPALVAARAAEQF